jgi:RNA polymerase sigma factor (sigma-70 family)
MPHLKEEKQIVVYLSKTLVTIYIQLSKKLCKRNKVEILTDELSIYEKNNTYNNNYNYNSTYLRDAIDKLSNLQKKIIIYYYYYGYKDSEISKLLGISRQTIYKYKKKSYAILRKELEERI